MELTPENMTSIHLIDENFLYTDEIAEKYSWKKKYKVSYYPSSDKFFTDNSGKKLSGPGVHIVILAVQLEKPDKQIKVDIVHRLNSIYPGLEIIRICHDKEFPGECESIRLGNVVKIVNNENAMMRIDSAIRWVVAKANLENKHRKYKLALMFLLISLFVSATIIFILPW
jgi:hypothetical protein